MKILAIDDSPFILQEICKIATKGQFPQMVAASSVQEAMMALAEAAQPFDCFILDINLPDDGAIQFCSNIRRIPTYRVTPIIVLGSTGQKGVLEKALHEGATDYATKPVETFELCARLRAAEKFAKLQRECVNPSSSTSSLSDVSHMVDLTEEISFDGVANLVDYESFANHLAHLSPSVLQSSQVVAVKIDQIESIFARSSSSEYLYALSEVANAIGDIFQVFGYQMAYAGRGRFVISSNKASLEPSLFVEDKIQSILDERYLEYDNGMPLNIDVSVGNPLRPTITKMRRISKTVDRALARAENRSARKKSEPSYAEHPLCRFPIFD